VVVEGDFLRVAQAGVDHLEIRTVRVEAENGATIRRRILAALLRLDVETAVADGAVDAAVRSEREAVHVMTGEGHAHAEAVLDHIPHVRRAGALGIAQRPHLRDAREVNRALIGHYARSGAIEHIVELVRVGARLFVDAVVVQVLQLADFLGLLGHRRDRLLGLPLLVHGQAVGIGLGGNVVQIPVKVLAVVLHAEAEAVGLRHVERARLIEGDGGGRKDAVRLRVPREVVGHALRGGEGGIPLYGGEGVVLLRHDDGG